MNILLESTELYSSFGPIANLADIGTSGGFSFQSEPRLRGTIAPGNLNCSGASNIITCPAAVLTANLIVNDTENRVFTDKSAIILPAYSHR